MGNIHHTKYTCYRSIYLNDCGFIWQIAQSILWWTERPFCLYYHEHKMPLLPSKDSVSYYKFYDIVYKWYGFFRLPVDILLKLYYVYGHYNVPAWTSRHLKSSASGPFSKKLFDLTRKATSKPHISGSLWGESTSGRCILRTEGAVPSLWMHSQLLYDYDDIFLWCFERPHTIWR